MIALFYMESCPFSEVTPTGEVTGCPSYVYAKLNSPLIVGSVYEISMWVYFPKNAAVDTTIYKNIGFNLTLKPERLGYHEVIATDYFFGDSIPCDQWYEIKHYIRALCPLKYITLGTFYDDHFPRLHRSIDNPVYYFVDDVKVIEVNEDSLSSDIEPTPFCNYYEKKQKISESQQPRETTVYFETASAILDEGDMASLDSFYAHTSGNTGNLYIVSGHTDNQGSENIMLSKQRANAVATYLQEKYKLSPYKFVTFSLGYSKPIGDNHTDNGRQQNRRVTISNSNIRTSAAVYRKGMEHMHNGDMASALKAFGIWLNTVPANQRMSILHDPRLSKMQSDPAWHSLVGHVREYYKTYVKPEDAFFLDSMFFIDQRFRSYTPVAITGYIPGLDTFDVGMPDMSLAHLEKTDAINLHTLDNFLKNRPFPIISEVGRHQVRAACLIYIHSLDSIEMEKLLPILESNCLQGEAEWDMYATLFDKLQLVRDRPQEYGTQSILEHGQKRLYKYDSLDAVNARRKKIGMIPISDH
jgi:outer membrane protein OmpA-like peptidoglycan-associated protein